MGFDSRGALSTLVATADGRTGSMVRRGHDSQKGGGVRGGADMHLAGPANPLGLFEYQTFDNEDYNLFLADFTKRVNGECAQLHATANTVPCTCLRNHQSVLVQICC